MEFYTADCRLLHYPLAILSVINVFLTSLNATLFSSADP